MADTTYTDGVTKITADTMNDVNRLHYTIFGDPATAEDALAALQKKGADVASAGTINLDSATGDFVHVTGTTGITAITLTSGDCCTTVFDDALTITYHATTLILPGNADITTAAGDVAIWRGDGSGNTRCVAYLRRTGLSQVVPGTGVATALAVALGSAGSMLSGLKVGSFTRDLTVASGNQAVTGVGFQPRILLFLTGTPTANNASVGLSDATTQGAIYQDNGSKQFLSVSTMALRIETGATATYTGTVASMDSDGFTVSWTKAGTPTGTATITYLAIR